MSKSEMDFLGNNDVFKKIEGLLKDNHVILLGDMDFLGHVENSLYMDGNNEDFKLFSGAFTSNSKIMTIAVIKKTKELQEFIGLDDNNKWRQLLCLSQDKVDGILIRVDGVYSVPKWGITKSIRLLLNCIITSLDATQELEARGVPFKWKNLLVLYCDKDDYQKYWFNKGNNKKSKRKRTHIPKGLRHEVFKRDNYTCCECGAKKEDGATLHIDHIIPVSKGGTDELDNLQTLCKDCNLNKSDLIQGD